MTDLKIKVDQCIGCGTCAAVYPEVFAMKEGKAIIKEGAEISEAKTEEVTSVCPVSAIVKAGKDE